jgi:cyclopropane-fatty-acyl-phospholipid synthase
LEIQEGDDRLVSGTGDLSATVRVHDPRSYGALLRNGSVGLGLSYVAGWWDSDDLTSFVQILARRSAPLRERVDRVARNRIVSPLLDLLWKRSRSERVRDRQNIHAHYDVSNEFFEQVLDETMTYSCAIFADPSEDLKSAQLRKIERLCQKLELSPDDHLIEIGSGWGALAMYAAQTYGCRVTTTTVAEEQHRYVAERVEANGLADRVAVLGADWRDLSGKFDKLVSVEMIEAVDWQHHDEFLAKCAELLNDDGLACIQMIVIDDASFERSKRHADFIRALIFPGSCIPSIGSVASSLSRATDLRIIDLDDIGRHYAETLRRWHENLRDHAEALAELGVETAFERLFSLYLSYCEASFLERHISDVQILLAKSRWRDELKVRSSR